jgi:hypothetical protein
MVVVVVMVGVVDHVRLTRDYLEDYLVREVVHSAGWWVGRWRGERGRRLGTLYAISVLRVAKRAPRFRGI